MSLVMIAYAYKKESGGFLWTDDRSRADEWETEGKVLYTRRVWMNTRGRAWFKPGDQWTPLRKEKVR